MVKRVVLGRSGEEKVVDLIKQLSLRASEGNTSPAGNKVLHPNEDFYWSRLDGTSHSMRKLDGVMEQTRIELAEAIENLEDLNNVQLPELWDKLDKLGELDDVQEILDELDRLGSEVKEAGKLVTKGPPPDDPVIGSTLWVAPNGRVYRAVDCEEDDE